MKFMFVVGGTYKGFYINELKNINEIDLLVFQQNIFYIFDYEKEIVSDGVVTEELIYLNQKLNCPIVVYGTYKFMNEIKKCFIVCVNGNVAVVDDSKVFYLYVKGRLVLISNKIYNKSRAFAIISIMDKKIEIENIYKNLPSNYFICDKKGVFKIQNGKIYRKFRKYCYFVLSFNGKNGIM
jgi:hypothetical protein